MTDENDLHTLIASIYDAALDEALWPAAMERLIAQTDSQAASFCVLDSSERPRLPTFVSVNFPAQLIEEYLDFMAPHDPTIKHIVSHPEQTFHHDSSFISEREKDRHVYYDWHHKFSDTRHRMVGIINPAPGIQSGITIHRTRVKGDFDAESLAIFKLLFKHVERALQIGFRLGTLGTLHQVSLDFLDRNPLGIVLLDEMGGVILANRAARRLAEAADGLTLLRDSIALVHGGDNARLQRLIGDALTATHRSGVDPGGAMTALRRSGKRPFSIVVSPLSPAGFALTTLRPAACVVIADPERQDALPPDRLRALYGLTPAETRLANRLVAGDDVRHAAETLEVSYATARSQLAVIFRKTETRRQGELVRLLLTTLPFVG